jgi:hypothetical protein
MLSERQNMREVLRLSMRVSAGVYLGQSAGFTGTQDEQTGYC